MKKVFLVFLCAATFNAAKAQIQFGVKAGANLSTFAGKDIEDAKSVIGFNGGGLVRLPINENFKVQPEIVFSAQGSKGDGEFGEEKINLSYINIPVMFQYHTESGFFAETGPQVGFLAKSKLKSGDISVDIDEGMKKVDFAWGLGVGYQLPMGFGVNARYNHGLSSIFDSEGGESIKARNSVFQLGIFYVFGGE
ncbi:porin family protein [Flavihumibacter sp. UBA7668]|uniref:porin family protein n=1 Tax=Flavihumibacter sp. UBA7668 TaxID=1946542 RepID=UPI0025BDB7F8|nr:porin family protein [Flavihumibacter sp. UBA7668]